MWIGGSVTAACFRLSLSAWLGSTFHTCALAEAPGEWSAEANLPQRANSAPLARISQEPLVNELRVLKQRILSLEHEVGDLRTQLGSCKAGLNPGDDRKHVQSGLIFSSWHDLFWALLSAVLLFAGVYSFKFRWVIIARLQGTSSVANAVCVEASRQHPAQVEHQRVADSPSSNDGSYCKSRGRQRREFTSRIEKRYTPHPGDSSKESLSGESESHILESEASSEGERSVASRSRHMDRTAESPMFRPPPGLPPPESLSPSGLRSVSPPPGLPVPALLTPLELASPPEELSLPLPAASQLQAPKAGLLPLGMLLPAPNSSPASASLPASATPEAAAVQSRDAKRTGQAKETPTRCYDTSATPDSLVDSDNFRIQSSWASELQPAQRILEDCSHQERQQDDSIEDEASARWKAAVLATESKKGHVVPPETVTVQRSMMGVTIGWLQRRVVKYWSSIVSCGLHIAKLPVAVARSCRKWVKSGWHRSWCRLHRHAQNPQPYRSPELAELEGKSPEFRTKLSLRKPDAPAPHCNKVKSPTASTSAATAPAAAVGTTASNSGLRTGKQNRHKAAHGGATAIEGRHCAELQRWQRWAQGSVGQLAKVIQSPVFLVGATMLGLVLLGKVQHFEGVAGEQSTSSRVLGHAEVHTPNDIRFSKGACSLDAPLPHLRETQEPSESPDEKPRVVLYAPCVLKTFKGVAKKYRPSATWYFVKSPSKMKVEVKHRHEKPQFLFADQDNHTIVKFLLNNILPKFGEVTAATYDWYLSAGKGLIWMLAEPAGDGNMEASLRKYRPAMLDIASKLADQYMVVWINTKEHQSWIETWLTVTSYPALVVQQEAGDNERYTWTGDMTATKVLRFVEEVDQGEILPDRHISPLVDGLLVPSSQEKFPQCPEVTPRWFDKHTRRSRPSSTCMPVKLIVNYAASQQHS